MKLKNSTVIISIFIMIICTLSALGIAANSYEEGEYLFTSIMLSVAIVAGFSVDAGIKQAIAHES